MRPYYAEGSKTLAFEVAEQLGWELPDRVVAPIASGSLFTKINRGFEEWLELGPDRGRRAGHERRPGAGLLAGGHGVRRRHRRLQAGQAGHDRQVAGHRQPGRRPVRRRAGQRTGGSVDSVTDDEIRAGIRLLAETTGIFTETAGGVTTATLAKLAARGDIGPDERVVVFITGEGPEDPRRGARHVRDLRDRAPLRRVRQRRSRGLRRDGGHREYPRRSCGSLSPAGRAPPRSRGRRSPR
jgi:threonine synthase